MSGSRRTQRVASLIRGELARMLLEDVSDPRLKGVTISDVELSGDLKHARVLFTSQEGVVEKDLKRGLNRVVPFLKKKLGDNLGLRFVPQLEWQRDQHGDAVARVYSLLENLEKPQ